QRHRLGVTSTINPLVDLAALGEILLLDAPPRRMECFDISNISSTHIVASMVCFIDGKPANHLYRHYRIRTVAGQDDFASMAEVVRRRYSRVLHEAASISARAPLVADPTESHIDYSPDYSQEKLRDAVARVAEEPESRGIPRLPQLVIVDGGKGQLSSACHELQRLGLNDLPIIGLAKEFEEIYRPNNPLPLILSHDCGALKMLQRIRDEAHRFANGYHQLLMKRRIAESLLDDCPGMTDPKKKVLLEKFGSVTRLRTASQEAIEGTTGIGKKLAEQIFRFLAARS
ncbi:MAG: excinuclease ABC subunit UvrC, partial [Verrucomicrobia bacterium]|nr:excinuclease ABC subunit UvrC [Verrucomicrobiota bacterium]